MEEEEMSRPKFGSIYRRNRVWWIKYSRNRQVFVNPATVNSTRTPSGF